MESNIKLFLKKLFRKYNAIKISTQLFYKCYDYILLQFLHWLNQKHLNLIETKLGIHTVDNPTKYESLIPSEDADKDNKYSEALKVALQTPKVNNIAITGPYGSGKSSFLRTFEKKNREWIYLPISLATFKDEELLQHTLFSNTTTNDSTIIVNGDDKTKDTKYEINQLIEKSILQQIFYREEEQNIPSSRFKRIKNIKPYWLALHVGLLVLLSVLGIFLYAPKYYKSLFLISELPKLNESVLLGSFFIGAIYFIYQISKYLMNLQISKLNFKDGEIELGNKEKTSILNEHLDEILYFFEVTDYDVVVLEDLDRFGNTEIFIKLRELNTLINNSKEIGRRVVFIYAIKDEMFKDKDRTKFFDFILPIIPYINPSNSLEKIKAKFKQETTLDQDFLSDIALYIDDMRLLVNIYNEYMIYKYKLTSDNLDKNKLLAMIIYKNLYPSDFAKLHFNDGIVYKFLNNKINLIQQRINEKQKIINAKKIDIKNIENEKIDNIIELKMIYLYKLAQKVGATHYKINGEGEYLTLTDLLENTYFDSLLQSKSIHAYMYGYLRSYGRNDYDHRMALEFHDLQNEVNQDHTYEERANFIESSSNKTIEKLREEIEAIQSEIDKIKSSTLHKIIQDTNEDLFGDEFADKAILKFFIKEGKIDEDNYHDYISYFFEGSITLNDREFLLSVKNNQPLEFTYRLNKIDELIKRLKERDFEVSAILNFDLLMYLLRNEELPKNILEKFLEKLSDESEESIKFTFEFIDHIDRVYAVKFIPVLWKKFWWYVIKKSEFSQKKIDEYFDLLVKNANIEKLIELNVEDTLKDYINSQDCLFELDLNLNEKYENLFKRLGVKFESIKDINNNYPLFNYIYENNNYLINIDMLNKIAFVKGAPESEIEEKLKVAHYTTLKSLPLEKLMNYINENIQIYVKEVFLKIETNTQEAEETIIYLLNQDNKFIMFDKKIEIIKHIKTKISDISKIQNEKAVSGRTIYKELLEQNKVVPLWDNLLFYYQDNQNELDEAMIQFLNEKENYSELSKYKMDNKEIFGVDLLQGFSRKILKTNEINNDAYAKLIKSIIWKFPDLNMDSLSSNKVDMILANKKILLSQTIINSLKKNFQNKQIVLFQKYKDEFLEKMTEFELDDSDYLQIISSSEFTIDEKISILEKIDLVFFDNEKLVEIAIDIYEHSPKKITIELFNKLFEKGSYDHSLKILTVQIPYLDNQKIIECLEQFDSPYVDLTEKSAKELKFINNELNVNLLRALENKSFISKVKFDEKTIKAIRFRK